MRSDAAARRRRYRQQLRRAFPLPSISAMKGPATTDEALPILIALHGEREALSDTAYAHYVPMLRLEEITYDG